MAERHCPPRACIPGGRAVSATRCVWSIRFYYNLTITFVSVIVAMLIGGIEVLALIANQFALKGAFWNAVAALSDNFGVLGYVIVGIFAASWLVSAAIYKLKRYDDLALD